MLKISKANKYFFSGKKNQIHVIDNTSLEFEANGMVALLGPSGCGKTTLLNAIGGLDKIDSGDIVINGHSIARVRSNSKDALRNEYIGYIFQNYNLVEDMTVFDNVAIVLKMLGIKDKKEIEEKVRYVLEKVGMYRYRKRYASMLSGGERQRVGIARAIVKNPPIIIADEPTGNLDSRNTLEVMNIIKAISKDKLVILVTHEENLANFYCTRIIRLKDGRVVSDEANDHKKGLDYVMDNRIYLGDMKEKEVYGGSIGDVNIYSNDAEKVNLDIVVKNSNIYIRSGDPNNRIEVVDDNSSIEMVNDRYREMTKEEQEKYQFDSQVLKHKQKIKYSSTISFVEMIKNGFSKVLNYPRTKKILLGGFLVSAMFILYAISSAFGIMTLDETEFVKINRDYLKSEAKNITIEKFEQMEADDSVGYMLPGDSKIGMKLIIDNFYQTSKAQEIVNASLSDISTVKESDITAGSMPKNDREILVDTSALTPNFYGQEGTLIQAGFSQKSDLVGQKVRIGNMGEFTISGIVDLKSPSVYAEKNLFNDMIANSEKADEGDQSSNTVAYTDYKLMEDKIDIKGGSLPKDDYEVMVNEKNKTDMPIGSKLAEKINGKNLEVVGYYSEDNGSDAMLVNSKMIKYSNIENNEGFVVYPKDKTTAMERFSKAGVAVGDSYEMSKAEYKQSMQKEMFSMLLMSMIIFVISIIEIYLMMRASFLSRIKEVGVYRAIGMKKSDIYKMFIGEVSAITTLASLPGFIFMGYILHKLTSISMLADQFMFNPFIVVLGLVVIYGVNIFFGLLPVWRTVRKTPAEILARNDI